MSWYEIVDAPSGSRYAVAAFPTGTLNGGSPGATENPFLGGGVALPLTWLVNKLLLRGAWTVWVGPWGGVRRRRFYSERHLSQALAESRAGAVAELIARGEWDPARGAPSP